MSFFKGFHNLNEGAILIVALIFLTVLSVMGLSMAGLVMQQHKLNQIKVDKEYSFQIAEAGMNYARWRLAHDNSDYSSETRVFNDPAGGFVGTYRVTFNTSSTPTNNIVIINSEGWYKTNENHKRIISARYGKIGYTQYSFLTNSNIYFNGGSRDGKIHANGGIRMDSESNSTVDSARLTYDFGSSTPTCADPDNIKDGVWRCDGTTRPLWQYPVDNIDFANITVDLSVLRDYAKCFDDPSCTDYTGNGFYEGNMNQGVHLIFKSDGTVDVYRVKQVEPKVWSWSVEDGWKKTSTEIKNEDFEYTYTLQGNDLIFVEDDVWVEGIVDGRVTVVAAKLPSVPPSPDIVLKGDIIYEDKNGGDVLGLLAQNDILMPLIPSNGTTPIPSTGSYEVDAALLAQEGRFQRKFYYVFDSGIPPYYVFSKITLYGSMISYGQPGNYWGVYSGYQHGVLSTVNVYDPQLLYNPPPYFPTSGEYQLISWEEKEKGE